MRNLGLDLLRIVAVLLVCVRHMTLPEGTPSFFLHWRQGGWIGVDLFFVLSGFLVSGLLFREYARKQSVDIKRFLIRRAFKIYPAFYVFLLFTVAVALATGAKIPGERLAGEIFFLQNYLGGLWAHTWSLAVEEHFYLGLALIFFVLGRGAAGKSARRFASVPLLCLAVAVICLGWRVANAAFAPGFTVRGDLIPTHLRIDSLMFGVLLSYWHHCGDLAQRLRRISAGVLLGGGALLLAPAFFASLEKDQWLSTYGFTLFYIGSGLLVLAAIRLETSRWRLLNLLGILGASSYSIYLWHLAVEKYARAFAGKIGGSIEFPIYAALYLGGGLALGWIMGRLVEWPALRLRDALFPSQTKALEESGPGATVPPKRPEAPPTPLAADAG